MSSAGNTPAATAMAIVGLVGAAAALAISFVVRAFDCETGGCSGGTALLVIACAGVALVFGMLVESVRRRGHPWYWFFAAAFVYGFWGVVFLSLVG